MCDSAAMLNFLVKNLFILPIVFSLFAIKNQTDSCNGYFSDGCNCIYLNSNPLFFLCLNTSFVFTNYDPYTWCYIPGVGPRTGSRPMQSMQMHRSEKIADAFIGQIFNANNKKQHFLRKHTAYNAKISTKLLFPRNHYDTYSKFTSKRFVFPKTYPRTITLTFPPLIYISRCFKIYYSIMSISRFSSWILYMFSRVHVLNVFMQSHIMSDHKWNITNYAHKSIYQCMF